MLIKHKTQMFQTVSAGPWHGVEPVTIPELTPSNRWSGPKIPADLWSQILAFLAWSYEETKSETIVTLFCNVDAGLWDALVLPQDGYNGMTVSLLDDHPNRIPTYARLGGGNPRGWTPMGSVHHHCGAGAFQSGTDNSDERGKEGIHITIGKLNAPAYEIHARTSFRQTMFEAELPDWFAEDPAIVDLVPHHLRAKVLEWNLTQRPAPGATFPAWWKDNVIKVERPKTIVTYNYPGMPARGNFAEGADGIWRPNGAAPVPKPAANGAKPGAQSLSEGFKLKCFRSELLEKCSGVDTTSEELRAAANDLDHATRNAGWLIDIMVANGIALGTAELEIAGMINDLEIEEDQAEVKLEARIAELELIQESGNLTAEQAAELNTAYQGFEFTAE